MLTNCIAKAKLVYNKKLQSYKLVVAFNAHKRIVKKGTTQVVKYSFPTQAKCAYVSGDISAKTLQADLAQMLPNVYATLRTNTVEFVE
jgi:hypothetical protein